MLVNNKNIFVFLCIVTISAFSKESEGIAKNCSQYSVLAIAKDLVDSIAHGGFYNPNELKCQSIQSKSVKIPFGQFAESKKNLEDSVVLDFAKGDSIKLTDGPNELKYGKNAEVKSERYVVHYSIFQKNKKKRMDGEFIFKMVYSDEMIETFGCAYIEKIPDLLFIDSKCLKK